MTSKPSATISLVEAYSQLEPEYLLICTYTLSLGYVEQKFLNTFKEKHNSKILLVTSELGISQSFDDSFAVRGAGTNYLVANINDSPYAFHPKVMLAIDKKQGLILFVSGCNFTYTGLSLNLDAVDFIKLSDASLEIIEELKYFLTGLEMLLETNEQKKILFAIKKRLPEGNGENKQSLFFHNFNRSIFDQIKSVVQKEIVQLHVISPYYDNNMHALKVLMASFGNPATDIMCNMGDAHVHLEALPAKVRVFTPGVAHADRYLHAKAYLIKTTTEFYIVMGSANCTTPGLLEVAGDAGNWEAVTLRKVLESQFHNFYQIFEPTFVPKGSYWSYTPPPSKEPQSTSLIRFVPVYYMNRITIKFTSSFSSNLVTGSITLHFGDTRLPSFHFQETQLDADKSFSVKIDAMQKLEGIPCLVELVLDTPNAGIGRAWLIQSQVLARTHNSTKLIDQVKGLQGNTATVEDTQKIIQFIADNIGYVAVRPRPSSGKQSKRKESNQIPTITGIVEVDELLPTKHHDPMSVSDFANIRASVEHLIEKGIQQIEGEDDEGEEKSERRGSPGDPPGNSEKERIRPEGGPVIVLPNFEVLFRDKIVQPFNNNLAIEESVEAEDRSTQYAVMFDLVSFCFKLLRFLSVEFPKVKSAQKTPVNTAAISFFGDPKPFLDAFPKWIQSAYETYGLTIHALKELMDDSEFISEFGLFLVEAWLVDPGSKHLTKMTQSMILVIRDIYSEADLDSILNKTVKNSLRFDPGRNNLQTSRGNISAALKSIYAFADNVERNKTIYQKCMKVKYWERAKCKHLQALDALNERKSQNIDLIRQHKERANKASRFAKQFLSEIDKRLGDSVTEKLKYDATHYSYEEIYFEKQTICPVCEFPIGIDAILTLKSFQHIHCQSCHALILPVNEAVPYEFQNYHPSEWVHGL